MKITSFLILTLIFFCMNNIYAGNEVKTTVDVPTIQCGTCKKNITIALENTEGVISAKVDMKTKKVEVIYDEEKTDVSSIENAITSAGYDANDKKADPVAYEKLYECCKVGGMH